MCDCGCGLTTGEGRQRSVLWVLLGVNAAMFLVELVWGVAAESTALIADAMDMLTDALVYGISLYAVGRTITDKARAAFISGLFQMLLGLGVAVDVGRRLLGGSMPEPLVMLSVGLLALIANLFCLALIFRHRKGEIHMRASWVFSRNDVLANAGVIFGGMLVAVFGSPLPDLAIGVVIACLVVRGGIQILHGAMAAIKDTA